MTSTFRALPPETTVGALNPVDIVGLRANGGSLLVQPGPDAFAYEGPGQTMLLPSPEELELREAAKPEKDIMVTWARQAYGDRSYWDILLSDRTLAIMARRVMQVGAQSLSSQFGYFETTPYPFVWSEGHALENLVFSVDMFANAYPPESPPSKQQVIQWWRDLVWTVAQVYGDNVRQGILYKRQLTDGPVNPGMVARPRVPDRAGNREINTAPYVLSHPWGHGGNFPLR